MVSAPHVLVVEDDRELRLFYEDLLRGFGYGVTAAANGAEALILVGVRPDLVLLDLRMPILDGYAFLDELRTHHPGPPLKVLIVSASPDARKLASLGPVRVLRKPFDVGELLATVGSLAGAVPAG